MAAIPWGSKRRTAAPATVKEAKTPPRVQIVVSYEHIEKMGVEFFKKLCQAGEVVVVVSKKPKTEDDANKLA